MGFTLIDLISKCVYKLQKLPKRISIGTIFKTVVTRVIFITWSLRLL